MRTLAEEAGFADPETFAQEYRLLMQGSNILEMIDRRGEAASTAARVGEMLIDRYHVEATN